MTRSAIPERLVNLVQSGGLVPVVGKDADPARSASELTRLLEIFADCEFPAILSLSPSSPIADFLISLGWQIKDRASAQYRPETQMLIELGPVEGSADEADTAGYWAAIEHKEPYAWECARAFAAREALLVIDCDPHDIVTRATIGSLRSRIHFRKGGWVIWHAPIDPDIELQLIESGFEVVIITKAQLIAEMQAARANIYLDHGDVSLQTYADANKSPYKLLHYFDVADRHIFFGREDEIEGLANLISAYPLVVVTGASGSGKTSLLNAGIIPRFARNPPYEGFYVRFRDDPFKSLESALELPGRERSPDPAAGQLSIFESLAAAMAERDLLPVIIFDQFEELFVRFPPLVQESFWEFIRQCLVSSRLPIRFVVVIRDDYLGRLAAMRHQYPALLQNTFYVPPLSRKKALSAMIRPAEKIGIRFDEALASRIIDELQRRQAVSAPELQIVCHALFEARVDGEMSEAAYDGLGGCGKILATFMNSELGRRGDGFRLQGEKVLKALVTSERTKENLPVRAIARRAKLDLKSTNEILRVLRDECRFVRNLTGGEGEFELSHDYLAEEITSWMSAQESEERLAHDLLDRELRAWKQFGSIRLGPDRLTYFQETLYDELLDDDGLLYLLLSSIRYLVSVERWTASLTAMTVQRQRRLSFMLFEFFEKADLAIRREAAEVIGLLDSSCIVDAVSSPTSARRKAAVEMAGGLRLKAAVGPLLALVQDDRLDEESRILACGALGEMAPESPDILECLLRLARETSIPRLRNEVIASLGNSLADADAFALVCEALTSDVAERREAGVAAIRQGQPAALIERLLQAKLYPDIIEDVKAELWDAVLRSRQKESDPIIRRIVGLLERVDLLRLDYDKWKHHWLYATLIHEFCRRWPGECSSAKQPNCAIIIENCTYTIEWMRRALRAGCADVVISHLSYRSDTAALGGFLRELIGSGERALQIMALRLTCSKPPRMAEALRRFVPASRVRSFLKSPDAGEKYWACLVTGFLGYRENVEILREMCADRAFVKPHDAGIGFEVRDAACRALDILSPGSAVWRKSWQTSFRQGADRPDEGT